MFLIKNLIISLILVSISTAIGATIIETGGNDVQVSEMGGTGNTDFNATFPDLAYNAINDEYVAVWSGDDQMDEVFEIYARRINNLGQPLGTQVIISGITTTNVGGFRPLIAHNTVRNEYLVIWLGGNFQIYVQRIASNLQPIGNELNISAVGPAPERGASRPAVAFNAVDDEYLIVWLADDPTAGLVDNEFEIFGQLLDGDANEIGTNNFRISDAGGTGDAERGAVAPDVLFDVNNKQYLVVWIADDDTTGQVDQEFEVYGQLLNASGQEIGVNDFRISSMGGIGQTNFTAIDPVIAFDSVKDRWLVVWYGDDNVGGLIDGEIEVFGSLLDVTGQNIESIRISYMGGTGNTDYLAFQPDVIYHPVTQEYMVSWQGDQPTWPGGQTNSDEYEIWVQRVDANGMLINAACPISDMGENDGSQFDAVTSALAANTANGEVLAVWSGTDDASGGVIGELEVWSQRLSEVPIFTNGFELDLIFEK